MDTAVHTPEREAPGDSDEDRQGPLERLAGFRFTYLAIFLFLIAYVFSVEAFEAVMTAHFNSQVEAATHVDPDDGPVAGQVRDRLDALLASSAWIRVGRIRVRPIVLGADGTTLLFAGSYAPPVAPSDSNGAELLPAIVDVEVSVPHNALAANGILVAYAALLLTSLIGYTRRLTRLEEQALRGVMDERASMAERARSIALELGQVRGRLAEVEPEKEIYFEEIETLQDERTRLRARLAEVEDREASLRAAAAGSSELNEERRALEELLEEATGDLESKDDEIRRLQKQVKRTGKGASKDSELMTRRLRTLYKELEVDDHAIEGILALGDESQKLRAEEALKKLCDDPENAGVRRKVGGLPVHLNVFEMGFAGKGRLYTTKGQSRRFRVLLVGGKASQKTDLEYLSRLPKGT
ncbi:MAG: hypothetical protein GY937_03705 [bacterium]|nr:hypothetical protein [bacterium]